MKNYLLIVIFLLVSTIGLGQSILEARVDFYVSNVTTVEALMALKAQTGLEIAFSDNFFSDEKVNFDFRNQSIRSILKEILKTSEVDFKLLDDQLLLFKKEKTPNKYTISGFIEDAETGERLIGVSVFSKAHRKGTISNEYGFYSLTLQEGKTTLIYNYIGTKAIRRSVHLQTNQQINLGLNPSIVLEEVIVTPFRDSLFQQQVGISKSNIDIRQINIQPDLGGESDIFRAIQLLPGVQTGADGLGGLHVRGGNADQNLFLLDGVPIYNPSHLMGLFSIYNTSAVRSAKLIKGGFPARYGGRISSVFDVRTREGNVKEWSGEARLGLVSGNATLEGPFAKDKGAFLLTGRRSHSNFLLETINREAFYNVENGDLKYNFYDVNAKVHYAFSQKDKLYLSYYQGGDDFNARLDEEFEEDDIKEEYETINGLNWGNQISVLRWNHLYNDRLFSNTTLSFSRYQFHNVFLETSEFEDDDEENKTFFFFEYESDIKDLALTTDFDYSPSPNHAIRFGAGVIRHQFIPGAFIADEADEIEYDSIDIDEFSNAYDAPEILTDELFVYLEDAIKLSPKLDINIGLRGSAFLEETRIYIFPEPRFSMNYQIASSLSATANFSRMVQYLHKVSPSGLSTPDEVWIPSTDFIRPQDAWQSGLGLSLLTKSGFEISVEGYYKKMNNLLSFGDSIPEFSIAEELEEKLIPGKGWGSGLELMLKKTSGQTGGWLSYTFAKSNRQFEDLNEGIRYAHQYDRRHSMTFYLFHRFKKNLTFSANWFYGSSNPRLVVAENEFINTLTPVNGESGKKNSVRSENYHRLDLSLSYDLKKPKLEHQFKLSLYNAYNRNNPVFYRRVRQENQQYSTETVNLLPILPSFSYEIKF